MALIYSAPSKARTTPLALLFQVHPDDIRGFHIILNNQHAFLRQRHGSTSQTLHTPNYDPEESLNGQFSTAVLGFDKESLGANNPHGVAYDSASGNYLIVNSSDDEVYGMNSYGLLEWHFDTTILGATTPEGITGNPVNDELFPVDSDTDTVYVIGMPRVNEGTTITGTFFAASIGIILEVEEAVAPVYSRPPQGPVEQHLPPRLPNS